MKPNLDEITREGQSELIAEWCKYYERQSVVVTVTRLKPFGEVHFFDLCELMDLGRESVTFIVLAPVTFLHLHDFRTGLGHATTKFFFMQDGAVLTEENTGLGVINYEEAFKEIVKRATGVSPDGIVPSVPESAMLTVEEEKILADKCESFNENLKLWIEKFSRLPAVKHAFYSEYRAPGRLGEIVVKTNFPDDASIDCYTLNLDNQVENPDWGAEGQASEVYEKWKGREISTYNELYNGLVELSNLYLNIPKL